MEMRCDTVEISGGRRLYRYTFFEDGAELPPVTEASMAQEAARREAEAEAATPGIDSVNG
jgi:hypothetical protein